VSSGGTDVAGLPGSHRSLRTGRADRTRRLPVSNRQDGNSSSLAEKKQRSTAKSVLRAVLGVLVAGATLYFLVFRLVRDWRQIPFDQLHLSIPLLIASFALLLGTRFPLEAFAWERILAALGERLPFRRAIAVISVTQLGKYIPGKLWFTLGRAAMARSDGVPETKTLVSVGIEIILSFFAALILLAAAVPVVPKGTLPRSIYWLLAAGPLCLILLYPPLLNRLLRPVLGWFKRPHFDVSLSYLTALKLVGLYLVDWALQGIGCFLLINSFYPLPLSKLPILLGGYATSWILGFIVLVAPAGLGVREGIYTLILGTIVPAPVAIMSALVTRIWMTLGESLMAGICLPAVLRWRKHGAQA
jgi:glycosyltransferase 2 family protein